MKNQLKFSCRPELKEPVLVVGWLADAGGLGARVTDYLLAELRGQPFGNIQPADFFPLGGVSIEDDIVQFPQSKFYACSKQNLIILRSTPPGFKWFDFLNLILDAAGEFQVKELYCVGGMVSLSPHTTPRQLIGTFNSADIGASMTRFGVSRGMDYETPAGQRPTLNSFLLWAARRRGIPGAALWATMPFYLVPIKDPSAQMKVIEYFNSRFELGMDLSRASDEVRLYNNFLAEVRNNVPELDRLIVKLESNLTLSEEENQILVGEIEKVFSQQRAGHLL